MDIKMTEQQYIALMEILNQAGSDIEDRHGEYNLRGRDDEWRHQRDLVEELIETFKAQSTMKDEFRCGVDGCDYTRRARIEDMYYFKVDTEHMYEHYKWEHHDLIGVYHPNRGVYANQDYWVYKPIPEGVWPTLHTQDGQTYTWNEVIENMGLVKAY